MPPLHLLRLSLLAGLLLFTLGASSVIAWKFGHAPQLGWKAFGWLYAPWTAVGWWNAWGHREPYRSLFMDALSLSALLIVLPFFALRAWQMLGPLQLDERPKNEGLGSARALRGTGEVKAAGGGFVLGRSGRFGPVLRDHGDGHILVMGPARSGKGAGHIVPTLLTYRGSMLVVDPKRELHAIAGRFRRELGTVRVLDPTDIGSSRLNPVTEIRLDDAGKPMVGDCQMMAAMLAYAGNGPSGKDEVWDDATADLLTTLFYHVRSSDDPTLAHLARLAVKIKAGAKVMSQDSWVRDQLEAHHKLHEKVRDSVNFTLRTRLAFLDDPLIQHVTGASEFRPGDLMAADHPLTLFLSVPSDQRRRLRPLTRLLLQTFWSPLTHDLGRVADGRVKKRGCLALIDEFPQLGRMDVLEHGIADCAGFGLRVALVCQDIDQINAAYGTSQSITANCSTVCAIPGFSGHGLDAMAKWAGQHSVAHRSKQNGLGALGRGITSQSETRVAVLNAREMLTRNTNEVLIFKHGVPPTWLRKVRYWQAREYRGLFDPPTGPASPPPVPNATEETPPWLLTHRI